MIVSDTFSFRILQYSIADDSVVRKKTFAEKLQYLRIDMTLDQSFLAVATMPGALILNPVTFEEIKIVPMLMCQSLKFSTDGKYFAASDMCSILYLFSVPTFISIRHFKDDICKGLDVIAFSPSSKTMATTGLEFAAITIWTVPALTVVRHLEGFSGFIVSVTFLNEATLISASDHAQLHIWNMADGKNLKVINEHKNALNSVVMDPTCTKFITCGIDKTVKVFSATTYTCLKSFQFGSPVCVAAFIDENTLIVALLNNHLHYVNIATGAIRQSSCYGDLVVGLIPLHLTHGASPSSIKSTACEQGSARTGDNVEEIQASLSELGIADVMNIIGLPEVSRSI